MAKKKTSNKKTAKVKTADTKAAEAKAAEANNLDAEIDVVLTTSLSGTNGSFVPGDTYTCSKKEAYALFNKDFCKLTAKSDVAAAKAIAKEQADAAASAESDNEKSE